MLTVVFADSVIAGAADDAPSVREALIRAGVTSDVVVYGGPYRTICDQDEHLEAALKLAPGLVVIAHSGAEAVPPLGPERGPSSGGVAHRLTMWSRENVVVSKARRTIRDAIRPRTETLVPFDVYAQAYAAFVRAWLDRSDAAIMLIANPGADPDYFPLDPDFLVRSRELATAISVVHPARVLLVNPEPHMRRWADFTKDRAHLSRSGEEQLARLIDEAWRGWR